MESDGLVGPIDQRWYDIVEQQELGLLDRVRGSAEKWAGTLTALVGLLGFTALVKGPTDVAALTPVGGIIVGVALLVAFLLAVAAMMLAALAAQGVPARLKNRGDTVRAAHIRAAKRAGKRLTLSRYLSLCFLGTLAFAIGYTWYGERATQPAGQTVTIQQSGVTLCGTLRTDDAGHLHLIARNGAVTPLDQVLSMTRVDACP
jgi:hypothetical protein